jgi:hypothetical protein
LNLKHDEALLNVAFDFNLRRYTKESDAGTVNSFFHHFDVLDVDAMPVGAPNIPQAGRSL